MRKYKFWSINVPIPKVDAAIGDMDWVWLCIPPSEEYLPIGPGCGLKHGEKYPLAAVRKHEEELLPPPSYWVDPNYENIVYHQ